MTEINRIKELQTFGYLATPYSHECSHVKNKRYGLVTQAAAYLFKEGLQIFSPISMTHDIDMVLYEHYDYPTVTDFWMALDEKIATVCDYLIVLQQPGWKESRGVHLEVEHFYQRAKPIFFMNPNNFNLKMIQNSSVCQFFPGV